MSGAGSVPGSHPKSSLRTQAQRQSTKESRAALFLVETCRGLEPTCLAALVTKPTTPNYVCSNHPTTSATQSILLGMRRQNKAFTINILVARVVFWIDSVL